ncbi:Dual specificity protein phosphatase 19 [Fragariocoptes setiger]|uniref:Dual specificity protein phosphatase 19 n=1 Tax=Fragariocoptes setiger TaxID=1670756 RepID=A0ABQ7SCW1_9ACAR|nr:Dual specificity protein phosphatase 19 [Fragariocoptes setiger]
MEDRSALFDQLRGFSQRKLKKVETKVVTPSGEQLVEKRGAKGLQTLTGDGAKGGASVEPTRKLDLQVGLILPGLLIGAHDVAHDKPTLELYGITHILNLDNTIENKFEDDYNYKTINLQDKPDADLASVFDDCFDFIDEGRHYGHVLVHCNGGVSRSTAICVAYLMTKEKQSFDTAFTQVKEARSFARPNEGFIRQLKEYDTKLAGSSKKADDKIDDAFTLKKRQEIENEKAMVAGAASVKNRMKMFGQQLDTGASAPGPRSKSVSPMPPKSPTPSYQQQQASGKVTAATTTKSMTPEPRSNRYKKTQETPQTPSASSQPDRPSFRRFQGEKNESQQASKVPSTPLDSPNRAPTWSSSGKTRASTQPPPPPPPPPPVSLFDPKTSSQKQPPPAPAPPPMNASMSRSVPGSTYNNNNSSSATHKSAPTESIKTDMKSQGDKVKPPTHRNQTQATANNDNSSSATLKQAAEPSPIVYGLRRPPPMRILRGISIERQDSVERSMSTTVKTGVGDTAQSKQHPSTAEIGHEPDYSYTPRARSATPTLVRRFEFSSEQNLYHQQPIERPQRSVWATINDNLRLSPTPQQQQQQQQQTYQQHQFYSQRQPIRHWNEHSDNYHQLPPRRNLPLKKQPSSGHDDKPTTGNNYLSSKTATDKSSNRSPSPSSVGAKHVSSTPASGLTRSSTKKLLNLIKTKTKGDLTMADAVDENDEIEALLGQLETESVDNIDWQELGLDEDEVKEIISSQSASNNVLDSSSSSSSEEEEDEEISEELETEEEEDEEEEEEEKGNTTKRTTQHFNKKYSQFSKMASSDQQVKKKDIETWVEQVLTHHDEAASQRSAFEMRLTALKSSLPTIDSLMQEWPPQVEANLGKSDFTFPSIDLPLSEYIDNICGLLGIPTKFGPTISLMLLFELYYEFTESQHFKTRATSQPNDKLTK